MMNTPHTTRLAPSPTGALHLGNARTFLINWSLARAHGWRVVLRIEDLDTPRVKAGAAEQAIEDLRWLGVDWDEGPYTQRADMTPYREAIESLRARGLVYPCVCTRTDIAAAQSAPHGDERELRYPGTCRGRETAVVAAQGGVNSRSSDSPLTAALSPKGEGDETPALRVVVPDEDVEITDMIAGPQRVNVQRHVGDFVVATKAGMPSYQLAVVVDDARQGVTDVVRGDDLIASAARQVILYRLLGMARRIPRYWHVPLVLGQDGRRLAKRHGDSRLATYRARGVCAERVVGLLARWSGVADARVEMSAAEFLSRFDVAKLSRFPVTMTAEDEAWLREARA